MKKKILLDLVSQTDCEQCDEAEKFLTSIKESNPQLVIRRIDLYTQEGKELAVKHFLIDLPAIFIDGELFSTGKLNQQTLLEKIAEI